MSPGDVAEAGEELAQLLVGDTLDEVLDVQVDTLPPAAATVNQTGLL